ncbi:Uncharacterised protein [Mycobacteroides abscessus subsp. abscessus]|nr:Uncharacterised protein [Mycobacteroides abscessus subsp. abscessus]
MVMAARSARAMRTGGTPGMLLPSSYREVTAAIASSP